MTIGSCCFSRDVVCNVNVRSTEHLWIQRMLLGGRRDFDLLDHITTSPNTIKDPNLLSTTSEHRKILAHSLDETYTHDQLLYHQSPLNVTSLNNRSPPYPLSNEISCLISKKPLERTAPWSRLLSVGWVHCPQSNKIMIPLLILYSVPTAWSSGFSVIPVAATERQRIRSNTKGAREPLQHRLTFPSKSRTSRELQCTWRLFPRWRS